MDFVPMLPSAFGLITIVTIYYLFLRNPGGLAVASRPR